MVDSNDSRDPSSQQSTVTDQGVDKGPPIPDITVTGDENELIGGLDPNSLDPTMHYRFVYTGGNKIARRLTRGYRFVRASEDGVKKLYGEEGTDSGDDMIRHGDTVLMCIPKEKHEAMEKRVRDISRARLAAPKGQFRKKARGLGVEVTDKKE